MLRLLLAVLACVSCGVCKQQMNARATQGDIHATMGKEGSMGDTLNERIGACTQEGFHTGQLPSIGSPVQSLA